MTFNSKRTLFALLLAGIFLGGRSAEAAAVYQEYETFLKAAVTEREQKVYDELDRDLMRYHISTEESTNLEEMRKLASDLGDKNSPAYKDTFEPPADQNIGQQIKKIQDIFRKLQGFSPSNFLGAAASSSNSAVAEQGQAAHPMSVADGPSDDGRGARMLANPIALASSIAGAQPATEQKTPREPEHYEYGRNVGQPQADDQYPQPNYSMQKCGTHDKAGC